MTDRNSLASCGIGEGRPCYVIAEAGVNHNGNLETAHRLIDAAAKAGADAVKFQTWITEEVCTQGAIKAEYQKLHGGDEDQFTMLKGLELPFVWHSELKAHAEERKIQFLSTPDDVASLRLLCDLGVPLIKIGSGEVSNLPYLAKIAATGKPLILSTGMSDLAKIARALQAIRSVAQPPEVALLHCVTAYPAPEEEMNLRCIATLREAFQVPVGLSDHTVGSLAAVLGVGLGMTVYEKHFTLDRRMPGPDHAASTEPEPFAALVAEIRKAERMMGDGVKGTTASEVTNVAVVQRVLVYGRNLAAGSAIQEGDIKALRCGQDGLGPAELPRFQGRVLRTAGVVDAVVREEDFQ